MGIAAVAASNQIYQGNSKAADKAKTNIIFNEATESTVSSGMTGTQTQLRQSSPDEHFGFMERRSRKDVLISEGGFTQTERGAEGEEVTVDYLQFIHDYMQQLFVKIQNGETEPEYRIGGRSFTIKGWDEFLEKFDTAEEAIREAVAEEVNKDVELKSEDARMDMLVSDTVQARFPTQQMDEKGSRMDDVYLTAIDKDGIRCSKAGQEEYEWQIIFTDESQYRKASEFMEWAQGEMDNFLFAAHENFWEDYLNGDIDVQAFQEFLAGTNNGIPNYGIGDENEMRIDTDKAKWASYMNNPGAKFYTAEEMWAMVEKEIEANTAKMMKLTDFAAYGDSYRRLHPEYHGEAIFCQYPGGPLYTAAEMARIMYEQAKV